MTPLANQILPALVALGLTTGLAAAAEPVTARGEITLLDPSARSLAVKTVTGDEIMLKCTKSSQFMLDGNSATLAAFKKGQRVRATYEKVGDENRVIAMRTAVPTSADLSREITETLKTARAYGHDKKAVYEQKMREVVNDVDDRIDDLRAQAKTASADAKDELNDRVAKLVRERAKFSNRLDRAKPAAKDAWDSFKTGVGEAGDDLQRALNRFRDDK